MQLIDTHAHLLPQYYTEQEIDEIITTAIGHSVSRIVNVGFNKDSSQFSCGLSQKHEDIYAAIGIHPQEANQFTPELLTHFSGLRSIYPKIVAIGEIGLDYYYMHSDKELQKQVLRNMLGFARSINLPVILHIRDAWEDIFPILSETGINPQKVVFHCFTGDAKAAAQINEIGAYISLTGVITFNNFNKVSITEFPIERIMLETDCPYLTPIPYRGKRNTPQYLPIIAEQLSKIKNIPLSQTGEITTENAKFFFNIQ
ncbi:MAG: hypothetical protein A2X43_07445 [Candidatus Margulisbacteria bacterium GWD2_39_127]|nr:MAG: hypothetical protein A2X43_07445 [Candidatus Margulisbacteria bacterium GWD2_39_127]OGI08212.1 MAG: hypothetical protein A2X41_00705 [Candidatus Margulisbacteria bacterium GWE2_39_32]